MLVTLYGWALGSQSKDPILLWTAEYLADNLNAIVLHTWVADSITAFSVSTRSQAYSGSWSLRIRLVTKLSSVDRDFPNIQKMLGGLRWIIDVLAHIRVLREMGLLLRYRF